MGLRLVRIGDKVSVGEVKSLSFRRSMRNSAVILYVVALWVAFVILGRILDDIPEWVGLVFSTINVSFIGIIDKQLPTRKNKNMFLMFAFMAFGLACIGVGGDCPATRTKSQAQKEVGILVRRFCYGITINKDRK